MKSKICGISDLNILSFLTSHPYSPQFIGFIVNYKKSKRFVELDKLKDLLKTDKKKSYYVAVLVKPDQKILRDIESLPFDYYQIYDCEPNEIKMIKENYNKKIITALTIQSSEDVKRSVLFKDVTDIYLFDSKGYEKSISFDHSLLKNDKLENYKEIADIIDISGGVETSGLKDISKIEIFLQKKKQINDEN